MSIPVIIYLTIRIDGFNPIQLKTKVEELAKKSKDNEYLVDTKLADKEKEIQLLRERDSMNAKQ